MPRKITFSTTPPKGDRIHHIHEDDIRTLISRLPDHLYSRLQCVYLNDRSRGAKVLGYVNRGHRDIAICALPKRVSVSAALENGATAQQFGAPPNGPWPIIALRRFLLYDVFLHELGHLQIIDEQAKTKRRKFAMETKAQQFANHWRQQLWSQHFNHPDPAHNPPTEQELASLEPIET